MEKVKELVKGKKMVVIASTVVAIVIVSVIGVYAVLGNKTILEVKKEGVVVEYGETISLEPKEYLTVDNDIVKDIKTTTNIKNEENKEYPGIGKYEIIFTYQKEKVVVNVEVKDTVAPVFNTCDSVEFVKGTDFNYNEYIKAMDLQEVSYDFKKDTVDVNTVGEYTLKVIATDKSNNQTSKDIKVKVLDTVDTTTKEVTTKVDDKGNVTTSIKDKPKEEQPIPPNNNTSNPNPSKPTPPSSKPTPPSSTNTPPPPVEKPHQHYASFISPLFDTTDEVEQWADNYLASQSFPWKYNGYVGARCSCGKSGVTDFY